MHSTVGNDRLALGSKLQSTRTIQDAFLRKHWFEQNIKDCQAAGTRDSLTSEVTIKRKK